MAVVVKPDIIEAARVVEVAGKIVELDRIVKVTGLTGSSKTLVDALDDAAMPKVGDEHPTLDAHDLFLEDRQAVSERGASNAEVILTYRWQPAQVTFVDGGVGIEQIVATKYPDPYPFAPSKAGLPIVVKHPLLNLDTNGERAQGARINVASSQGTITLTNVLTVANEDQAIRHLDAFRRKINRSEFVLSGDAEKWMIVSGTSQIVAWSSSGIGGNAIRARFFWDLQYKKEGWNNITVVATNPKDNLPFSDVDVAAISSQAVEVVHYFELVNFSSLNTITA